MSHSVEFSVPFDHLEELAKTYANEQGIHLPEGNFYFRIEQNKRVGFCLDRDKPKLGVRVEKI